VIPRRGKRGLAQPGDTVRLYYHEPTAELGPGDALITSTGRVYLIMDARRQLRGKHIGRWHLRCVVAEEIPVHLKHVYPLVWDRRSSKLFRS
jgi:hypothetical protein